MRQGRLHIGSLIAKGDRDFATDVDLHIESAIKSSLAAAAPTIPFLPTASIPKGCGGCATSCARSRRREGRF
jgi:3'-phosphoadenosine 5'-phosphosulfate (PAPS) 3'-phosphatase